MAIKKQEFYEGAALHVLARNGPITSLRYSAPFFSINEQLLALFKYSTKGRSPWSFTFTADEQAILQIKAADSDIVIGLVCGADGVAAFPYSSYLTIATPRKTAVHISCFRQHGEHYEVCGPDGTMNGKISPSYWRRILER